MNGDFMDDDVNVKVWMLISFPFAVCAMSAISLCCCRRCF